MPVPFVVGNWKMNQLLQDIRDFFEILKAHSWAGVDVGLAPAFVHLAEVLNFKDSLPLFVGAQDCHSQNSGAHTGDVSTSMIRDLGAQFVILGHSERRQNHGESSGLVNEKAKMAISTGLTALVCVGETLEQREAGQTQDWIAGQIRESLKDLEPDHLVLAYEPIWAIGTGKNATPQQAQEVHAFIRNLLRELFQEKADDLRILYGGSVKPENADSLLSCQDINGVLVGGASLKADSFFEIVSAALKNKE